MTTMKENWKLVTIGGVTGILMGAGTVYAVQSLASDSEGDVASGANDGMKVAHVSDQLSFRHAFDAARAEVGPGGVFEWRGHIYNTYTAAEWKAMSHEEKNLFAARVKPEVSAADVDTRQIAQRENAAEDAQSAENVSDEDAQVTENAAAEQSDADVRVAATAESAAEQEVATAKVADETTEVQNHTTSWNELVNEENDVRVLGFKDIAVGSGRSITMQELDINGQRVAIIDVDKDGKPDLAMSDLNHDHHMDEGEVIDLHTGEAISFTNDDSMADNNIDFDLPTV